MDRDHTRFILNFMLVLPRLPTVAVILLLTAGIMSATGFAIEDEGPAKLLADARAAARNISYSEALEKLQGALQLARQNNEVLMQAIILENMAEVHLFQKNSFEALGRYIEALTIYQDMDHQLGVQAVEKKLAALSGQTPTAQEPPGRAAAVKTPPPGLAASVREKLIEYAIDRIRSRVRAKHAGKDQRDATEFDTSDNTP